MDSKKIPAGYVKVDKTERNLAEKALLGNPSPGHDKATVTLIVKRRGDTAPIKSLEQFQDEKLSQRRVLTHAEFRDTHGAAQKDVDTVIEFAKEHGLRVIESDLARRSVVVRGNVEQLNKAFGVELHEAAAHKSCRTYSGAVHLPKAVAAVVEHVIGLDNQPVPAKHYSADPPATKALTPQEVAVLYNFPKGDGAGQTIGIYEMVTSDGPPGYNVTDVEQTLKGFGGGLSLPSLTGVSVNGQANSNVSDGETLLDITVAGAIAQKAAIAVYFTGPATQDMVHALQQMIHPSQGAPVPTILSISYGWGPDDDTTIMNSGDYEQLSALFQDAAQMGLTVLVSSGDSGVQLASNAKHAQASYPASDPWVLACGGTTIGSIKGSSFTEYVWNEGPQGGATGGGVSAFFALPAYQKTAKVPKRNAPGGKVGRGVPDIAGNASPASGYKLHMQGQVQQTGGTSAVAPLYAGLMAVLNGLLGGNKVGFINPLLYAEGDAVCKDISAPPGPANNNYGGIDGYPAGKGWNACTGLGSVNGSNLLAALQKALGAKAA